MSTAMDHLPLMPSIGEDVLVRAMTLSMWFHEKVVESGEKQFVVGSGMGERVFDVTDVGRTWFRFPVSGDKVRVRLDPGGAWYFGTMIEEDSLHFSVNQSPFKKWRYGDLNVTWVPGWSTGEG